jgi:hypothetical protein
MSGGAAASGPAVARGRSGSFWSRRAPAYSSGIRIGPFANRR